MALKVPNQGELYLLDLILADQDNWTLRLFKNNVTPGDSDTFATYTEADFDGYNSIDGTDLNMAAATTVTGKASSTGDQQTFEHDGGGASNSIYGYYVTIGAGGGAKVLWAERLPSPPQTMANMGDNIKVTPKFTFSSES